MGQVQICRENGRIQVRREKMCCYTYQVNILSCHNIAPYIVSIKTFMQNRNILMIYLAKAAADKTMRFIITVGTFYLTNDQFKSFRLVVARHSVFPVYYTVGKL